MVILHAFLVSFLAADYNGERHYCKSYLISSYLMTQYKCVRSFIYLLFVFSSALKKKIIERWWCSIRLYLQSYTTIN